MIHIKFPLGQVFGTAGITVLVAVGLIVVSEVSHSIVNVTSSHPSLGIIQIFWFHSRCFGYTNISSLIFAVPKCNRSLVLGSWRFISIYHHLELSVQNIFTSFQLITYDGFVIEGEAKEIQIKRVNIAERNINNFFMKKVKNKKQ